MLTIDDVLKIHPTMDYACIRTKDQPNTWKFKLSNKILWCNQWGEWYGQLIGENSTKDFFSEQSACVWFLR